MKALLYTPHRVEHNPPYRVGARPSDTISEGLTSGPRCLYCVLVQASYSADTTELDQPARDGEQERLGKAIRVRIPLLLFRLREGDSAGSGVYRSWNNVSWIVECADAAEATSLRDALQAFFAAVNHEGLEAVVDRLTASARVA